jgi:hypothetical protein
MLGRVFTLIEHAGAQRIGDECEVDEGREHDVEFLES